MKISRLRLLGFKSFVEPTELIIEGGLTGVVGPNGCGKSNLLEALRWVMGETSHKSMRAAAMDDVIFSGTTSRPARNVAEVTLFLDNSERQAPAEFNDSDVIEITRRIERDAGSAYRINGSESRARDVKILFEDAATGARSPALVRQGQISEIVNAKPEQRRRVLEDAAGIAGLHSRRHEAELRLKGAEQNLARMADIMGQLGSQIESLKRQARQARRYKDLSEEIRRAEALLAHLSWIDAQSLVETEERNFAEGLAILGRVTEDESKAIREEAELAETIQPLRGKEAERGAALSRIRIETEGLAKEAARCSERRQELAKLAGELDKDLAREAHQISEAKEILAGFDVETKALEDAEAEAEAAEDHIHAAEEEAAATLEAAEKELAVVTERAAEARARRKTLETAEAERHAAIAKIDAKLAQLVRDTESAAAGAPDSLKLASITEQGQRLAREISAIEAATLEAEDKLGDIAETARVRSEEAQAARMALSKLVTERETLHKLVMPTYEDGMPPVVEQLRVAPGYEAALVAALGDDLDAPVHEDAAVRWRMIEVSPEDETLPADAEPLSLHVGAPPELLRRLRQIGVVSRELGARLQPHLKQGQRLVSREGDLWRWDGFIAVAGGMTPAAQRLAERNRLADMFEREKMARTEVQRLTARDQEATAAHTAAAAEEKRLRALWRDTQAQHVATRDALAAIERQARETEAKLVAIAEARTRAESDRTESQAALDHIEDELARLDAEDDPAARLPEVQKTAQDRRTALSVAQARVATHARERETRKRRTETITAERTRWTTRSQSASEHIAALEERCAKTKSDVAALEEVIPALEDRRQSLLGALSDAEQARNAAADDLARAENALRAAAQALRDSQAAVSAARESRARVETRLEGARTRRQEESRRIREALNVNPDECLSLAGLTSSDTLPGLAEADRALQRMKTDRERLGGVNLQADDELNALLEQMSGMETERDDVEQAIAKLRGAIGQLNREGKKRLDEAFETVNGHFQRLFTTLFGGGEARLELIEGEDPLESGLEIIAKPPGKKPATLSLLSGGEQTLTALSLIFAVFLTNPSPICVLDEVDAPLDDANVDRFCTLMEKMAEETATRFLVITHHPMTMMRMNRLFGVTMAEKGVSQLVSVDLETAKSFREAG
ncbi:chromosome segregation protein SMC [Hyphomicrobium sp.]|uniref:chromosome segregation protein SMC n=1 Tax=Hyphomicrobium sp. TaxID=82 RepID=UPI002E2EE78C|nr:chromosome segregation protein SMC [Hyphomicrobium sp.]HEX2841973.1 chromosome segregation protein SMC [Hyphomicrobium sp.]